MRLKNSPRKRPCRLPTTVRLGVAAVAACFLAVPVLANPVNPTVVNGIATFNQIGKVLTVTNSPGAIINWQKFSIQAGETTHFAQTAASSTVLNRVLSDPTAIYGTLSSNGRVWLVNPAGIMVGPGGRVDVAGFVASTLNISNADFLAGRNIFINDGSARNVINQGEIRTPAGGSVYLIGSNVSNEGIITTPKGETILAAGATVSLVDSATPGVKVDITGAEGNATNLGSLTAEAGRIGIAGVIVRNSGTVNASSVVAEGGRVFLKASQDAYVDANGRIVTTGTKGGSVEVLGNRVAVMDKAKIDASGENGGGRIMVGGDYQGKNPEVQNANVTYFGPNASLKADAGKVGAGGTVIVWADDTTRAYGNISARGGAAGGDGGFVETSGKRFLDVQGIRVDVGANEGKGGLWLLDPSDINIVASGTTNTEYAGGVFSYGGNIGTVDDGDINAALYGGDVTITTNGAGSSIGDIKFDASTGPVTISNTSDAVRALTLTADNDIKFYGGETTFNTTAAGSLGVNFNPAVNRKVAVESGATVNFYGGAPGVFVAAYIGGAATGRSWENYGTIKLDGVSYIDLYANTYSDFKNKPGGVLNVNSMQGWPIQSRNDFQDGQITNEGVVNFNTVSGAFEAQYDQKPGGVLNVGATSVLSMQNAGTIYGGVNITGPGGRLVISEIHGGARTFYGANISGGGILDIARPTTFIGSTMSNGVLAKTNGDLNVPGSGLAFSGDMTFVSNSSVAFEPGVQNFSTLKVLAGWDGNGFTGADVTGTGNINIPSSQINASNNIDLHAAGDITLGQTGIGSSRTWIQSNGVMSVSAKNLSLYGGQTGIFDISGLQGPGVILRGDISQTIEVENQILLQAGSANNTVYAGSSIYGGAVAIQSGGSQTISANAIKIFAGASGHDNGAEIQAYGGQSITAYAGGIEVRGGDGSTGVYGGAGSFNNQARIQHGQWTGPHAQAGTGEQNITIYSGGTVSVVAGSGTGVLGYYGSDCVSSGATVAECSGSSNGAQIENLVGSQTLNFPAGGALHVTGGSAGTNNWAAVENSGTGSQAIYGSPTITLYGGSAGGSAVFYGGKFYEQTNDAGIYSEGGGNQYLTANTLLINGGNAAYGGAGIGNDGTGGTLEITTLGDMSMYGGVTSNADHPYGAPVYIHREAGGSIILGVGGNLYVKAGSGNSTPAIIGSFNGQADVSINAAGKVNVIADGSGASIGALSAGYGATVTINSGESINLTASTTRSVLIGSGSDSLGATAVTLNAGKSIAVTGTASAGVGLGVMALTGGSYGSSVAMNAGWNANLDSPSGFGGDITLTGLVGIQTKSTIDIVANQSSAGAYGGVSVGADTIVYGGSISIIAGGNNVVYGSLVSTGAGIKGINLDAGWNDYADNSSLYGGDLILKTGSSLQSASYVDMSAQAGSNSPYGGGSITQYGGLTSVYGISMYADRNITINGNVTSSGSNIYGRAGYSETRQFGGNIEVRSGSLLSGKYGVELVAESGSSSGANGRITQYENSFINSSAGSVNIIGGGDVELGGSIDGGEGCCMPAVRVRAGYYGGTATLYGGNIQLTETSTIYGSNDIGLYAWAGSSSGLNGNIIQDPGSVVWARNYDKDISIVSAGDTTINGKLSAGERVSIGAGLDPSIPNNASGYGGNISFGSGSTVESRYGDYSDVSIAIVTRGGSRSQGDITQAAGAQLTTNYYYGYANILAYGDAKMNGTTTIADDGGYGINVVAGAENTSGMNSDFYGGVRVGSSNIVSIGSFSAVGGYARVKAAGAILQSTSNLSGTNIVADDVTLTSINGGLSNQLAISAITEATDSITANVNSGASYGGIVIKNNGTVQPTSVSLTDNATTNSRVSFTHYGSDLALNNLMNFSTHGAVGDILIAAPSNNLTYSGADLYGGNVLLGAGGNLTIASVLNKPDSTLGLGAFNTLDVNSNVTGNNVALFAQNINLAAGVSASVNSGGPSAIENPVNGASVEVSGIRFIAGNVDASVPTAYLSATGLIGNVYGLVSGNITLNYCAYFRAGRDIDLIFTGSASTLSLSNGSYLWANATETITLDFSASQSGGVMISGAGSGFFTGPGKILATEGAGLMTVQFVPPSTPPPPPAETCSTNPSLCPPPPPPPEETCATNPSLCPPPPPVETCATNPSLCPPPPPVETCATNPSLCPPPPPVETCATNPSLCPPPPAIVDPCAANPDLCKPPSPTENVIVALVEMQPPPPPPPPPRPGEPAKVEKGNFGSEEAEKTSTPSDDKEKKEKPSDEAKDGKKDEKPSQKKVAQCGV